MNDSHLLSPRRLVQWSEALNNKELGYFPVPPINELHKRTDKYIEGRLSAYFVHLILLNHDDFMKAGGNAENAGVGTLLPDGIWRAILEQLRGYFKIDGALTEHASGYLDDANLPPLGINKIIFICGMRVTRAKEPYHANSKMSEFFRGVAENFDEYNKYSAYFVNEVRAGKRRVLLSPKKYFKHPNRKALWGLSSSSASEEPDGLGNPPHGDFRL